MPGVFLISPTLQFLYALMMYIPTTPIWFVLKPLKMGSDENAGKTGVPSPRPPESIPTSSMSKTLPMCPSLRFRKPKEHTAESKLPTKFLKDGKLSKDRADDDDDAIDNNTETEENQPTTFLSQITSQLLSLLNQELPFLYACTMLVLLIDNKALRSQSYPWLNVWGVIFEIAASWGTAGLTLATGSLCLAYHLSPASRFVFTVVMIKARLRVPVAIDPIVDLDLDGEFAAANSQLSLENASASRGPRLVAKGLSLQQFQEMKTSTIVTPLHVDSEQISASGNLSSGKGTAVL